MEAIKYILLPILKTPSFCSYIGMETVSAFREIFTMRIFLDNGIGKNKFFRALAQSECDYGCVFMYLQQ